MFVSIAEISYGEYPQTIYGPWQIQGFLGATTALGRLFFRLWGHCLLGKLYFYTVSRMTHAD